MQKDNEEGSREGSFKNRGHGRGRGGRMGKGHGRRRMRGRPKADPSIQFQWDQVAGNVVVELSIIEVECLRLCDGVGQTQEEAANSLEVSRGTIWRALSSAREKLAIAIQKGKTIEIEFLGINEVS